MQTKHQKFLRIINQLNFHHMGLRKEITSVIKKEIIAMILAGGQGSRLKQLTKMTAKPAVPFELRVYCFW